MRLRSQALSALAAGLKATLDFAVPSPDLYKLVSSPEGPSVGGPHAHPTGRR
jgi:hypothetical protein